MAPAAPHSRRETTCRIAVKFIKKIFLTLANQADCEWSVRCFLTQKDRNRHWQSDKFRPSALSQRAQRYAEGRRESFKSGRTQSFLTGSTVRGEALKERSEGGWRSGRRRSGDVGGGDSVTASVCSVSCRVSTEHALCQKPRPVTNYPL